jgi:hypothetical protein
MKKIVPSRPWLEKSGILWKDNQEVYSLDSIRHQLTIKDPSILVLNVPTSKDLPKDRRRIIAEVRIFDIKESPCLKGTILDSIQFEYEAIPFVGLAGIGSASFSANGVLVESDSY